MEIDTSRSLEEQFGYKFKAYAEPWRDVQWQPDWKKAYARDGVVYCGICHKPLVKPMDWKLPHRGIAAAVVCDCYLEKTAMFEERKKAEEQASRNLELMRRISVFSIVDARYRSASFSNFDMDVNQSIQIAKLRGEKYCNASEEVKSRGLGICFYGDKGLGKSFIMGCMANELQKKLQTVVMTSVPSMCARIRESFDGGDREGEEKKTARLVDVDFLLLDDIGSTVLSDWEQKKVHEIVDRRYNAGRPIVFSTNYKLSELVSRNYSTQTIDRLNAMATAMIVMRGENYRKRERTRNERSLPF